MIGFCGEGYEGVACSTCQPGYIKSEGSSNNTCLCETNMFIDNKRCIALDSIGTSYLAKFASFSVLHIFVMAFIIR